MVSFVEIGLVIMEKKLKMLKVCGGTGGRAPDKGLSEKFIKLSALVITKHAVMEDIELSN